MLPRSCAGESTEEDLGSAHSGAMRRPCGSPSRVGGGSNGGASAIERGRRAPKLPMVIQSLRNVFNDLMVDKHEIDPANMTPEMKKSVLRKRMQLYKIICYCGVAVMMWTDKAVLLNRVYQYNHTAAQICTVYLTMALVSMLLGLIASSFPDSAPYAMGVAWNGTLQVFLFLIAFMHMTIVEVYPELLHLTVSFIVISVLFSIYWSFCARDPTVRLAKVADHK